MRVLVFCANFGPISSAICGSRGCGARPLCGWTNPWLRSKNKVAAVSFSDDLTPSPLLFIFLRKADL